MTHEVETMAYTNEVPWHGLGYRVDKGTTTGKGAVERMIKAAKIDWTVEKMPLFMADGTPVDAAALVRSTDNSILDVVGSGYVPIQNHEAFAFFNDFVEAGDATMETAGSLKNGQYVWGLASLGDAFTLKGNDTVKGYVLVGCPHQQGRSLIIKFTTVRVVCNNTLTLALGTSSAKTAGGVILPEFRKAHRSTFDRAAIKGAQAALGIAREQLDEFEVTARALQKKSMSRQDAIEVLAPIFAPKFDETMTMENLTPRMAQLMDILEKAPGAQPDNAWGVLNAVTYYADHVASRTDDRRLTQAWFGKTANQKEETLRVLIAA